MQTLSWLFDSLQRKHSHMSCIFDVIWKAYKIKLFSLDELNFWKIWKRKLLFMEIKFIQIVAWEFYSFGNFFHLFNLLTWKLLMSKVRYMSFWKYFWNFQKIKIKNYLCLSLKFFWRSMNSFKVEIISNNWTLSKV